MINLGDEVIDKVTGYRGIAIGKTIWLTGCTTFGVKAKMKEDGTIADSIWFDEPQLETIHKGVIEREKTDIGGPKSETPNKNRGPK